MLLLLNFLSQLMLLLKLSKVLSLGKLGCNLLANAVADPMGLDSSQGWGNYGELRRSDAGQSIFRTNHCQQGLSEEA